LAVISFRLIAVQVKFLPV